MNIKILKNTKVFSIVMAKILHVGKKQNVTRNQVNADMLTNQLKQQGIVPLL